MQWKTVSQRTVLKIVVQPLLRVWSCEVS